MKDKIIEFVIVVFMMAIVVSAAIGFFVLYGKFVQWLVTINGYLAMFACILIFCAWIYAVAWLISEAVKSLYKKGE